MNRRVLIGLTALAMSQAACQRGAENALRIMALPDVLPPQVLGDFKAALAGEATLKLKTQKNWVDLFQQLQVWHQSAIANNSAALKNQADWVCMSDYWLLAAIQQQLISPIGDANQLAGWSQLPDIWSTLLRRNEQGRLAESGALWGTPYRWGQLVMVYDSRPFERLGWQPSTWLDLLRPELQERIALPNHPRLVLGLLLKALGHSANDRNPASHDDVLSAIDELKSQVKVYASEYYLQSLIMGDLWLAVGWSTEIQPLLLRYRQLRAVVPLPGTLLTADIWVKPNVQQEAQEAIALTPLDQKWLAYWWQQDVITPLSLFSQGLSPQLLSSEEITRPFDRPAEAVIPTAEQLQNSEFIEPLPTAAIATYNELWQRLRGRK